MSGNATVLMVSAWMFLFKQFQCGCCSLNSFNVDVADQTVSMWMLLIKMFQCGCCRLQSFTVDVAY